MISWSGHRAPRDLPADRIEAGDDDVAGVLVEDHLHAGEVLEGADVPPLDPDDPAAEVVVGQRDRRHRALRREIRRETLDGERHDLLGLAVRVALDLFLDEAHLAGRRLARLGPQCLGDLAFRLVPRERGGLFETNEPLFFEPHRDPLLLELLGALLDLTLSLAQELVSPRQGPVPVHEAPMPRLGLGLRVLDLLATTALLLGVALALARELLVRLLEQVGGLVLGSASCAGDDALRLVLGAGEDALSPARSDPPSEPDAESQRDERRSNGDQKGHQAARFGSGSHR